MVKYKIKLQLTKKGAYFLKSLDDEAIFILPFPYMLTDFELSKKVEEKILKEAYSSYSVVGTKETLENGDYVAVYLPGIPKDGPPSFVGKVFDAYKSASTFKVKIPKTANGPLGRYANKKSMLFNIDTIGEQTPGKVTCRHALFDEVESLIHDSQMVRGCEEKLNELNSCLYSICCQYNIEEERIPEFPIELSKSICGGTVDKIIEALKPEIETIKNDKHDKEV